MADYTPIPQDAAQTRTNAANNIGQKFSEVVLEAARTKDIFSMLEGNAGGNSVVQLKTELTGGKADKVHIPVIGTVRGEGVRGDGALEGNEDFLIENFFYVQLDEIVNGLSYTQLSKMLKTYGGSYDSILARSMSDWLGWKRQTDALMKLRTAAASRQTLRPRSVTRNLLLSSDTISTAFIDRLGPVASAVGVKPVNQKVAELGAVINGFLIYGPDDIMHSLNGDSSYQEAANYAQERGMGNTQFAGGYVKWRNHSILHHVIHDEDTYGPIGTPFIPKVLLGAAASGTTVDLGDGSGAAVDLYGSGVAQNTLSALDSRQSFWKPFSQFPGYDYLFTSFQSAAGADSTQYYAWLYDTTDAGIAFIRYQADTNTGVKITANRWTSNTTSADTTRAFRYLGGVNGDGSTLGLDSSSASYNYKTTGFTVGSTYLVPATKWGVPFGWAAVLGRASLLRAYGYAKLERIKNMRDYGRVRGEGILSVYGQNVPIDALGRKNGYVLAEVAVDHPGFLFPPVTAADVSGT